MSRGGRLGWEGSCFWSYCVPQAGVCSGPTPPSLLALVTLLSRETLETLPLLVSTLFSSSTSSSSSLPSPSRPLGPLPSHQTEGGGRNPSARPPLISFCFFFDFSHSLTALSLKSLKLPSRAHSLVLGQEMWRFCRSKNQEQKSSQSGASSRGCTSDRTRQDRRYNS
jgi:hypothetical protein